MNYVALTLSLLLLANSALALEGEVKTRLKYLDGASRSTIEYNPDRSFDQREERRKRRWESDTLLKIELTPEEEWQWSTRLGYNSRRTVDQKRTFREDGSLKKDKTRTEWRQYPYVGLGLRYDLGSHLGGDAWSLRLYHDRFLDVDYHSSDLAADAKPIAGRGSGYETEVSVRAEYMTPWYSLYLLPKLSLTHTRFSAWTNTAQNEVEKAEQELQYEAKLWLDWITPLAGWELIAGPSWQLEDQAERDPGQGWQWEDKEQWLATLKLEYASPDPGFEMELQAEHWLNGPDRDDTRYKVELSYEF
ncbi:hypothetical protein GCM10011352_40720 [Marinobacterium zhoushanense]|uniref:Uncharacterized protein n=1 Tax=Marinobacterium zhoushanense TaxID=1679163 RepID=A0ABQ1KX05_9GAMM|nr:hypothetical protein [Marinobacterium zhoushanense]GGC10124.1 hypothetical protein GCM10011352_40720 [Marinobacterium zhoushanense]